MVTEEPGAQSPPVVAVVVTCNPGPWFEDTLRSLADQDYPNLAVLVIDAASVEDPLGRIAGALPGAFVRRLTRNPGYAAAANRSLRIIQGATHLLFCHDDVALDSNAVSKMVDESRHKNAGVVTPKVVSWTDPTVLESLGGTVDRTGAFIAAVEPGERDQGQHDVTTDVMVASGSAMLVRTDLFEALGGFDAAITLFGEEIDFSWRAQLAGARIIAVPSARVRHLGAASRGMRLTLSGPNSDDPDSPPLLSADELSLRRRHRLRTALKVRNGVRLATTVVFLALLSTAEVIYSLLLGRSRHASAVAGAWLWNTMRWRDLVKAKRQLKRVRVVSDADIDKRLGSAHGRLEGLVRKEWERRTRRLHEEGWRGRDAIRIVRNLTFTTFAIIAALWLVGSRELLADGDLPSVGGFVPLANTPADAFSYFFGFRPDEGFGVAAAASPLHFLSGVFGVITLGAMDVAQKLLVLGMLPLGIWGMSRLVRPMASTRARLVSMLAYAAVPLPYDALGLGRLDGLAVYAAAPWILHRLLRVHGSAPFAIGGRRAGLLHVELHLRRRRNTDDELETLDVTRREEFPSAARLVEDKPPKSERRTGSEEHLSLRDRFMFLLLRRAVPLAVLVTTAGMFAPQVLTATAVVALFVIAGGWLAGGERSQGQAVHRLATALVVGIAIVLAAVVLLPSLSASAIGWSGLWNSPFSANDQSFAMLLSLSGGGAIASSLVMALLAAGTVGLLFGKGWHFGVSVQLWFVTVGCTALTWLSANDWLASLSLEPRTFLAFAAAAAALNAGLTVHVIAQDVSREQLIGRVRRHQVLALTSLALLVTAFVPVLQNAGNGSWYLPSVSNVELLSWTSQQRAEGSFRVLWLGEADALPGGPRPIAGDMSAAVSVDGPTPTAPGGPVDAGKTTDAIADSVAIARNAETVSLGRLTAPYGIRYIVVPEQTGAEAGPSLSVPPPDDLVGALDGQLDLVRTNSTAGVTIYENTAWAPMYADLDAQATLASRRDVTTDPSAALAFRLDELAPVMTSGSGDTHTGQVPGGEIYVGQTQSPGWQLEVDGREVAERDAFGWAMVFDAGDGGDARLSYRTGVFIPVLQTLVVAVWIALAVLAIRFRERRGGRR